MPRILHTADWQLGLPLLRLRDDRGAEARAERFRCVERIAALAKAENVDAVVVAGDVFDDNQVSPRVLQQARDALEAFAPIPVLLVPGNHDAAEPGNILERVPRDRPSLSHVHVLTTFDPLELDGVVYFPCPLLRRDTLADPTDGLPERDSGDTRVRIAISHGPVLDFGSGDAHNRIDFEAVERKGFDFLALGDWHGLKQVSARTWYPGAPEATRFVEQDPGKVLVVDIAEAGAEPVVTPHHVGGLAWHERRFELNGAADVDALRAWLLAHPNRSRTLVRLHLSGALLVEERARLDALLTQHESELMSLQVRTDEVVTIVDEAAVDAPGFLGEALEELLAKEDEAHRDAAVLLVRFLAQSAATGEVA